MYNIIIPIAADDVAILRKNLNYIHKNLEGNKVIAIGSQAVKRELDRAACSNIAFEDEDHIFPGMTLEKIRKILAERGVATKRAGWYFQQFLKISYAYRCQDEYYLTWDSDTIPIQHISMFENGKPVFDMKTEYHPAYFETMEKLFDGRIKKLFPRSFISEHMLFCTAYVKEMMSEIESNEHLEGNTFWEKILWAINLKDILGSGFSEFETYGNYVCKRYPNDYVLREKESLRAGAWFLGYDWTGEMIQWAARDYAVVSFEKNSTTSQRLCNVGEVISESFLKYLIHLKWVVAIYYKVEGIKRKVTRE